MMYDVSKLVALILAFCLGFGSCGGVLVGGTAIALGTFKVRDIENNGVDIPDEIILGENPEVDILGLTVFGFIDELKILSAMGDNLTINELQKRYDIKIPPSADKFLTDEARNIPVKKLLSEEGVKELLTSVYVGYVQSFECHQLDSTDPADPALGKEGARWYNPTTGQYVTGINETLSFISLGDFVSGRVDIQAIIGGLHIGEALGYYSETDPITGEEVWYDGVTGEPVSGIMAVFAGCTVYDIDDKINTVEIGELLGYYERDGVWYETDEDGNEKRLTGVISVFAGCQIDEIGSKINEAKVGDLLGYFWEIDTESGKEIWYEEDEDGNKKKVTGLMAVLAPSTLSKVGDTINGAKIGSLLGYEEIDGVWYEENELNGEFDKKVTGLMSVLAPSSINNVGDTINNAMLGDLLGYEKIDGNWYDEGVKVTGIMAVLSDSKMNSVGDTINNSQVGVLLGYDKIGEEWFEFNEETSAYDIPVDGFMGKIANQKLNNMGDAFDELTIGDIVSEEDRKEGFFAIMSPTTPITGIAGEINTKIKESPLQFFMNEELITFSTSETALDLASPKTKIHKNSEAYEKYYKGHGDWEMSGDYYLVPEWRNQPLGSSFNYIVKLLTKTPSLPIDE